MHDELRRTLISKLTQVNKRNLKKSPSCKVFIPGSSPQQELCVLFFFSLYSFLISKDLPLYPTIFLKSHLRKVCALLPSPSNTSPPELNSPPSPITALMEKGRCLQTQALPNLSRLNGSCLPKSAGQLFLEDAKSTIYGQSKQKSRAGKSECNT